MSETGTANGCESREASKGEDRAGEIEETKIFPRFLGQFDVSYQAARVTVVGTIFS